MENGVRKDGVNRLFHNKGSGVRPLKSKTGMTPLCNGKHLGRGVQAEHLRSHRGKTFRQRPIAAAKVNHRHAGRQIKP